MNTILIISTKGGVGKSTISTALAHVLSKSCQVGLLDADITNPCINTLLGIDKVDIRTDEMIHPIEVSSSLKVFSTAFLLDNKNIPVLWRGEKRRYLLEQYIESIYWGNIDYLVVDLPPGTSDEPLYIIEAIDENRGAVIVTIPWDISITNVRKSITMCRKLKVPIIGIIENMSGFICPKCGNSFDMKNKVVDLCKELNVPYLGKIPMDFSIATDSDNGNTNTLINSNYFLAIVSRIVSFFVGVGRNVQ